MSGSKTRFGFTGGSDPPDPEETRAARTLLGHDVHLQLPPDIAPPDFPVAHTPVPPRPPAEPTPEPLAPTAATPARPTVRVDDLDEQDPRRRHRPRQQSRLARFLGRWTKSGRFVSHGQAASSHRHTIEIPRDTTGRNLLLVLLVAFFTFIVTLALVKLRQRVVTRPAPPAAATVPEAPTPATAPPPYPPPLAQPSVEVSPPPPASPSSAKGLGSPAPGARRAQHAGRPVAEPPAHLKGELLPLDPPLEPYQP